MFVLRILPRSARFVVVNSWPLLAVVLAFLPVQFGLDRSYTYLYGQVEQTSWLVGLLIPGCLLLQILVDVFAQALVLALAWSKIMGTPLSFKSFRDWLALSFRVFFAFTALYYLAYILGFALFMLPLLAFVLAFPYLDIVILFEHAPLRKSVRRNFELLLAMPTPAVILSIIRFFFAGWIPLALILSRMPETYSDLYGFIWAIFSLPVDVTFLVLYAYLAKEKIPRFFYDVAFEDEDQE